MASKKNYSKHYQKVLRDQRIQQRNITEAGEDNYHSEDSDDEGESNIINNVSATHNDDEIEQVSTAGSQETESTIHQSGEENISDASVSDIILPNDNDLDDDLHMFEQNYEEESEGTDYEVPFHLRYRQYSSSSESEEEIQESKYE